MPRNPAPPVTKMIGCAMPAPYTPQTSESRGKDSSFFGFGFSVIVASVGTACAPCSLLQGERIGGSATLPPNLIESWGFHSLDGDLFWLLLRHFGLGNVHGENPILALAADRIRVHILREREAPLEAAIKALRAMVFLVLVLFLLFTLTLDGDHSIIEHHLDIL